MARKLLHTPITPNQITVFRGFLLIVVVILFFVSGTTTYVWAGLLILIHEILDYVDGDLAILRQQLTTMGELLEKIIDYSLYRLSGFLGFAITYSMYKQNQGWWVWIILFANVFGAYLFYAFDNLEIERTESGKKLSQDMVQNSRLGDIVKSLFWHVPTFVALGAFLYHPMMIYLRINPFLIIMVFFALLYNAIWLSVACTLLMKCRI